MALLISSILLLVRQFYRTMIFALGTWKQANHQQKLTMLNTPIITSHQTCCIKRLCVTMETILQPSQMHGACTLSSRTLESKLLTNTACAITLRVTSFTAFPRSTHRKLKQGIQKCNLRVDKRCNVWSTSVSISCQWEEPLIEYVIFFWVHGACWEESKQMIAA